MNSLDKYILDHIGTQSDLLKELDRVTHLNVVQPRMISGHLQGELLKMIVRMISPQKILEIGTFTGYSAICMASGMGEGGELHTIEIDDELQFISLPFFERSMQTMPARIIQHIGSALDIAPSLEMKFDLIFIDGDKREYPQYYETAMNHLVKSGSYILADNILWYGKVADETPAKDLFTLGIKHFNNIIIDDSRVENVILPIRDGLNLIRVK